MKIVHLFLTVLIMQYAIAEDNVVTIAVSSEEAQASLDDRFDTLLSEAKTVADKFQMFKGSAALKKFESKWKDRTDQRDINRVADEMLINKLKEIRDLKKEGKEIKIDIVYEACLIFLKYEDGNNKLPVCFIALLRDDPTYDSIKTVVVAIRKRLEDVTVASKEELGK